LDKFSSADGNGKEDEGKQGYITYIKHMHLIKNINFT
jgi:hypothetical protein